MRQHEQTGDPALLLDAGAHERANELYAKVVTERTDVPAMVLLARWSLARYGVLPQGRSHQDLRAARLLGTLLQQLAPEAIPPELAPLFEPMSAAVASASLAMSLVSQFEEHGNPNALGRAKLVLTEAIRAAPLDEDELANVLSTMAVVTANEFVVRGKLTDMDAAVRTAREAVRRTPPGSQLVVGNVAMLCWTLLLRHERTGDLRDLDEAIRRGRDLIEHGSAANPDLPIALLNLGSSLARRFERLGRVSDLDDGIALIRQAAAATPDRHPLKVYCLSTLGFCLMRRFGRIHDLRDCDESVQVATSLLRTVPRRGPLANMLLGNAASVMAARFGVTERRADLEEAVRLSRATMATGLEFERHRFWAMANHSAIMFMRYGETKAVQDIDEAMDAARAAIAATAPDDPWRTVGAGNLARLLTERAGSTGRVSDVDEAIELGAAAVATLSPGNPARARLLLVQAQALLCRHRLAGADADFDGAVGLLRSAASIRSGPPELRMSAVLRWYRAAAEAEDLPLAAEATTAAVRLLPLLAWRGLDRASREQRLADFSGVAPAAAALAVRSGQPERAVELLEQGRSVLWSQALQTRTDLTELRKQDPELAKRLDVARAELDGSESATHGRRRHAEQWDTLVGQVRRLPGFESFLAATPFDQLSQAAAAAPVVIVNASRIQPHALVVTPGRVRVITLDWLDFDAATQRAKVLLRAQQEAEAHRSPVTRAHLRQTLTSLLRWLWDTIADPVLSTMDTERITWCPTGPLTFLPLHAAGRHHHGRRGTGLTVPDRVVSSYTTTLTALLRSTAERPTTPRLLTVGMPTTPDFAPLPAVHNELAKIAAAVPSASTLVGPDATTNAVLANLDRYSRVHFACHGTQNSDQPSESAIQLHDGPLTVVKLAAHGLRNAELAYLSACHTATGSSQLADEAIHLTAALQTAGYRHVIGTQWSITDEHAADVAGAVYRELAAGRDPAAALANAVAPLRRAYLPHPELWAPYLHTGLH